MQMTDEQKEIVKGLSTAVVDMDEDAIETLCNQVIEKEIDPNTAIIEGLTAGMNQVGELYKTGEYFIPELVVCADVLYQGLDILKPHLKANSAVENRKIILGVVEGDIHDVGKNIVKAMFVANGWEVNDLGNDVTLSRFVEEQRNWKADVIGMSALMTTSMLAIPKAISMIRQVDEDVIIMIGGAPLNSHLAKEYKADGYAENGVLAVEAAEQLVRAAV